MRKIKKKNKAKLKESNKVNKKVEKEIYSPRNILDIVYKKGPFRPNKSYKLLMEKFIYNKFSSDTCKSILNGYSYLMDNKIYSSLDRLKILILCTTYLVNENIEFIENEELNNYIDINTPYKFICWSLLRSLRYISPNAVSIFSVLNNLMIDEIDKSIIEEYLYEEYDISKYQLRDFINESILLKENEDNKIKWFSPILRYINKEVGDFYFYRHLRLIQKR